MLASAANEFEVPTRGYRESGRNFKFAALVPARARSRHVALPMRVAQHLAGGGDIGRVQFGSRRKRLYGSVIAHDEIEYMSQKLRVGGGRPQRLRADSAFGQKQAQPLGIGGNERQRLNRNDFSHFAGVVNRLFQQTGFAFPLTYGL